jgi:hypothetical protein
MKWAEAVALTVAGSLLLASACRDQARQDAARSAELERAAKAAEAGGETAAGPSAPPATAPYSHLALPPSGPQQRWATAIAREIDSLDRRSRQALSVGLMRARNDPRQKSEDLIAHLQWCDEGSLAACLHAGHVLLFNECLFDRAHGLYRKAEALAEELPPGALDQLTVDGQLQRYELRVGLKLGDPASAADEQRRGIASICGAAAERDRQLWDGMFARYEGGGTVAPASPSSTEDRLMLGAIRKQMLIDVEMRIGILAQTHSASALGLRARLVDAASALCAQEDVVACAMVSYLHAADCKLAPMLEAYEKAEVDLAGLDAGSRALAVSLVQDLIGPIKMYKEATGPMRDMLKQSMCKGKSSESP